MPENISINLVRKRKIDILDQFINWATTGGRLIVILTEILALSAFIYRFGLDRQLSSLNDRITQEQNIVSFLKKNEDIYRNLQDRLNLASQIMLAENQNIQIYEDVKKLVPSDVDISNFTYSLDTIQIAASASSINSISTFVNKLKNYQYASAVSINNIENKSDYSIINISLTVYLKNNNFKNL